MPSPAEPWLFPLGLEDDVGRRKVSLIPAAQEKGARGSPLRSRKVELQYTSGPRNVEAARGSLRFVIPNSRADPTNPVGSRVSHSHNPACGLSRLAPVSRLRNKRTRRRRGPSAAVGGIRPLALPPRRLGFDRGQPNAARHGESVIRGHQRSSEVIRGHQRSSEVIRGH